jgi:pSer/pThr/pTyr-binding forkhead associated (FHA) protein
MSMWILQTTKAPGTPVTQGSPEPPEPDDTPLTFRLTSGAIRTIGRAARADFIVDRALVSRLHCRLTAGDEKLEVQDLSSTNGTFVNGKRVRRAQVASGDRLRVGRIELTVQRQV